MCMLYSWIKNSQIQLLDVYFGEVDEVTTYIINNMNVLIEKYIGAQNSGNIILLFGFRA